MENVIAILADKHDPNCTAQVENPDVNPFVDYAENLSSKLGVLDVLNVQPSFRSQLDFSIEENEVEKVATPQPVYPAQKEPVARIHRDSAPLIQPEPGTMGKALKVEIAGASTIPETLNNLGNATPSSPTVEKQVKMDRTNSVKEERKRNSFLDWKDKRVSTNNDKRLSTHNDIRFSTQNDKRISIQSTSQQDPQTKKGFMNRLSSIFNKRDQ